MFYSQLCIESNGDMGDVAEPSYYHLSEFEFALLTKHTDKMGRPYCGCDEGIGYVQFENYICCMPIYHEDEDLCIQLVMASCKVCSIVTFLHLQNLGLRYVGNRGLIERIVT